MINLENKVRIIQLDKYNMTFEVFKEVEDVKTKKKRLTWSKEGGYYGNLSQCLIAIKNYIISQENLKNDNLNIIQLLDEINNLYVKYIPMVEE